MAGKSNDLEGKLLNHIFRNTAYTAPGTVYIALMTAAPTDAGGGTEVSGGSYARASVTSNTTNWNAPSGTPRQISNVNDINFPTPTAEWAPAGTPVVAVAAYDNSTAGNLLYWTTKQADGTTDISKIIQIGDPVKIPAGQLIFRED